MEDEQSEGWSSTDQHQLSNGSGPSGPSTETRLGPPSWILSASN